MRLSKTGIGNIRINNLDEMYPIQDILFQTGQLVQYGSGIYAFDNIPYLLKQKVEKIIKDTLNKYDCIEISLPTMQPEYIWQQSGRWDKYIQDGTMLTIRTDKGNYAMAPTAEEAVVEFAKIRLKSYKNIPVTFYQIGEKFRNEIRTRGYLFRAKCFQMMDAYSFNKDEEDLIKSYNNIKNAYIEIFQKLGLEVIPVAADSGAIGGKKSEEFMLLSNIGEDKILYNKLTKAALNCEILEMENFKEYLKIEYNITDISLLEEKKAIELGHIFQLGTKYSESMNAKYKNQDGNDEKFYMGCYGIGVSRIIATIYENSALKDKQGKIEGFSLPKNISPYLLQIIPKNEDEKKLKEAEDIYNLLLENNILAILDDREQGTIGSKIKDCKMLGTPYMVILGDKLKEDELELEEISTGKKEIILKDDLIIKLNQILSN